MAASAIGTAQDWRRCATLVVAFCTIAHVSGTKFAARLGGSGQDYVASVATDAVGNTYVAGLTYSPDLAVTAGAFQTVIGGNGTLANPSSIASDAFAAKFSPNGTLLWCTFLGGSADDYATGVAVDAGGNVVVTGWTRSLDFPLANTAQPVKNNGASPFRWDAFVTKLDPGGSKLIYSTYLGGPDDDGAYGVAVDGAGNAYVTGRVTVAAGFTGFAATAAGFGAFVSKFDPRGSLVYSFFVPDISSNAIAVDSTGNAYLTGSVPSAVPIQGAHTFGPPGTSQALVVKLASDGSHIVYETALGGSVDANGLAIALDQSGSAGLYQIAIRLPANVPPGAVTIQASVGGTQAPTASIYIGNP